MYKESETVPFESVDQFNELMSQVKDDAYAEFVKISSYFSEYTKSNGGDSFNTLMVVFSQTKQPVAIVSCRAVENKDDLYKAMAQMLFLPASINSSLFILAQDAKISIFSKDNMKEEPEKSDALVITYVTKHKCIVFTVPYSIDENKEVKYFYDKSYLNSIASTDGTTQNIARGDMIELFFIFSHMDSTGPFSYHEVLTFMKNKGFEFQIINPSALEEKNIGIPVMMQG